MYQFKKEQLLLLLFLLISISAIMFYACRRQDHSFEKDYEKEFFNLTGSTSAIVKKAVARIFTQNKEHHFVSSLAKRVGLPNWEKSFARKINPLSSSSRTTGGEAEYVFIPFISMNSNIISSVLAIKMEGDSTWYKLVYPEEYSVYGFDYSNTEKINARSILNMFAYFNNLVFGYDEFIIKDEKLLNAGDIQMLNNLRLNFEDISVHFTIKDTTKANCENCSLAVQCPSVAVCFIPEGVTPCATCNATCSYFAGYSDCGSGWYGNIFESGSNGTGDGSGTGGGASWWEDPCEEDPTGNGRVEPCDGIQGWVGVDSIPAIEPIDSLLAKYGRAINYMADSLRNLGQSQNAEWFFAIVKYNDQIDTFRVKTDGSGVSVRPNYYMSGGRILLGGWHNHSDNGGSTGSGPSGDDLAQLYEQRNKQNFIVFTDCSNTRFAIVIEDPIKLNAWFHTPGNGPVLLPGKLRDLVYSDSRVWSTTEFQNMTVEKLLQIIGNSGTTGIGLYKSINTERTLFTKLN